MRNIPPRLLRATAAAFLCAAGPLSAEVPAGFVDERVALIGGVLTGLAFTPDGRLLITKQDGLLTVYPQLVTALQVRVCSNADRGLLGVAVDPAFASNRFVYLYYTFRKGDTCPFGSSSVVNRVSRFVLPDSNVVDPSSERVLIDEIPSVAGIHDGGDLQFGPDGYLYVSVGDGGCDYAGDSGCHGSNDASRDENILLGKILRIDPAGVTPADRIPPTNPYLGPDSEPCALAGRTTTPGKVRCQETFARGFRNPFRIAFDPDSKVPRFFVNDVGQDSWEEIDEGVAGADYGWNCREGAHTNSTTGKCAGLPPSAFRDPIFEYGHATGCRAVTGGAFVPAGSWPTGYDGDYLFADYVCNRIFRLESNGVGGYTASSFAGLQGDRVVALVFGPPGSNDRLYYVTQGGEVRRIWFERPLDWNGDGKADILWQDTTEGFLLAWFMNGAAATNAVLLSPPQVPTSWQIVGGGDLNRDKKPDLVWQDAATGLLAGWYMDGTTETSAEALFPYFLPPGFRVTGVADFNGDARPDLLVRDPTGGGIWILYANTAGNAFVTSAVVTPGGVPASWWVAGVADFNRDGKPDLLWQDLTDGLLAVSYMDGASATGFSLLSPGQVPTSWRLAGVADLSGDGKPDLLWQDTSGLLGLWIMDGVTATLAVPLSPSQVDTRWRIVLPR
jgi:glucose/arabinose dehydrogenase